MTRQRAADPRPVHTTLGGGGFTGAPMELHYAIDPSTVTGATGIRPGHDRHRGGSAAASSATCSVSACAASSPHGPRSSTYIQIWSFIENEGRAKASRSIPDVRQGWAKLEGPWGSFTAGRVRGLFSRGATDIDVLYAHRWGVGWPGAIDNNGPTQGMVGFGVLGSGFSAALLYGTPCSGACSSTSAPSTRPCSRRFGAWNAHQVSASGGGADVRAKVRGRLRQGRAVRQRRVPEGLQGRALHADVDRSRDDRHEPRLRRDGGRAPGTAAVSSSAPSTSGVAGHYGQGIGPQLRPRGRARPPRTCWATCAGSTGWYVQTQVVLGKFDLFAGWGFGADLPDRLRQEAPDAGSA